MKRSLATSTMVSVLACTSVLFISACTLFQGNENRQAAKVRQNANVYRGTVTPTGGIDAKSHYAMGCVFQEKKKHRLAITEFELAVKKDPSHAPAYNGLGVSLDAVGDYDEAQSAYRTALEIDPQLDYVFNNLGYSYLLQDRTELAIESFQRALSLNGNNARYHNNLGLAYSRMGNYDSALAAFEASGEKAEAHLKVARLYYGNGIYDKAAHHFAQASALKPSDRNSHKGLSAATNLAQIHAQDNNVGINQKARSVIIVKRPMVQQDNDDFYTIPAGAIEEFDIVQDDQFQMADITRDDDSDDHQAIYTLALAQDAQTENLGGASRLETETITQKIVTEAQALKALSVEVPDMDEQPKSRIRIEVSNGNGVRHMARDVGTYLTTKGFILMYLSNADHFSHSETDIYYTKGHLEEAYQLSQELPGRQTMEEVSALREGNAQIKVRIGRDLTNYLSLFEKK